MLDIRRLAVIPDNIIIYSAEIDFRCAEYADGRQRWFADQYRKTNNAGNRQRSSKRGYSTWQDCLKALQRGRPGFWEPWDEF
jgi:hypothetical protein